MGIGFLVQKEKEIKIMEKEKFTVSWIMADEALIKLKEPDETYDLTENVVKFIEDNKLQKKEDFQVEVEIDKEKGDNGTVTSLKEVGGTSGSEDTPKEESKEEKSDTTNAQSEDLVVKELTVNGVSVEKKSVIFKEEDKVWYNLDDTINAQEFKDKYTKKVVEVSVRKTDEGNDVIVSFTAKEENNSEDTEKSQEPKKSNSNMVQKSIEAQASINSANRVVANLFDVNTKPDDLLKNITKIAEHNFQLIQKLKNKD